MDGVVYDVEGNILRKVGEEDEPTVTQKTKTEEPEKVEEAESVAVIKKDRS